VVDLIIYAIPAFALLLAIEAISFQIAKREDLKGYELRDTRTSLSMGVGNVIINVGWKAVVLVIFAGLYELTPLRVPESAVWAWALLFFLDDFAYYWFHRISHEVRVFWASHVVHHSSQYFNLSTAVRQTWTPMTYFPFWAPIALLGYPPWMIFTMQAISLMYQFWIHTERIQKLPAWFELVFNTPSHHRVHHGSNDIYLDRNYGGVMIVWDRMFGTFQGEDEPVRYGLTKNLRTFSPPKVAFHEWQAVWADVRGARDWRERIGYAFGGPAWTPDDPNDRGLLGEPAAGLLPEPREAASHEH
jgi:sterol desaturase/sphingolipid hydroxylase (fatty acid hydroxylase superfamily)